MSRTVSQTSKPATSCGIIGFPSSAPFGRAPSPPLPTPLSHSHSARIFCKYLRSATKLIKTFCNCLAHALRSLGDEGEEQLRKHRVHRVTHTLTDSTYRIHFRQYFRHTIRVLRGFCTLPALAGICFADSMVTLLGDHQLGIGKKVSSFAVRA